MKTSFDKLKEERQAQIDKLIGQDMTFSEFENSLIDKIGQKYLIHNGWNVRDVQKLSKGDETCISGGIITDVFCHSGSIIVKLDDSQDEKFTKQAIKRVTEIDNKYYVIYNDNSYFKLIVE
jgi:hypothetical protein